MGDTVWIFHGCIFHGCMVWIEKNRSRGSLTGIKRLADILIRCARKNMVCAPVRRDYRQYRRTNHAFYLTCTMISSVDIAYYGVSRAKDWVSVNCCTIFFIHPAAKSRRALQIKAVRRHIKMQSYI